MPHSVSSEEKPRMDEEVLPDAPAAESGEGEKSGESDSSKPVEDGSANQQVDGIKLEDLFNDDVDDEFPVSSAAELRSSPPPQRQEYAYLFDCLAAIGY